MCLLLRKIQMVRVDGLKFWAISTHMLFLHLGIGQDGLMHKIGVRWCQYYPVHLGGQYWHGPIPTPEPHPISASQVGSTSESRCCGMMTTQVASDCWSFVFNSTIRWEHQKRNKLAWTCLIRVISSTAVFPFRGHLGSQQLHQLDRCRTVQPPTAHGICKPPWQC